MQSNRMTGAKTSMKKLKAPFPWFGGKSKVASEVWRRFGDVSGYIEPFAGTCAVLLCRPTPFTGVETVNDADGFVSNFWRALRADPEAVADHADWPVNEADLHARHLWLVGQREPMTERLMGDPDWYDAKIAGWWVWGISAWIGGGWCSGNGPWQSVGGVFTKGDSGKGVRQKLPHLSNYGQGVHRQRPHLGDSGIGVHRQHDGLHAWMQDLAARFRRVRVACGDFTRVLGPSVRTAGGKSCAVFLDPPYDLAIRDKGCYATDSDGVAVRAREWAVEHGNDQSIRIALCGYQGEHAMPEGWSCYEWSAAGGYSRDGSRGQSNRSLERIWFSPHCLNPKHEGQLWSA